MFSILLIYVGGLGGFPYNVHIPLFRRRGCGCLVLWTVGFQKSTDSSVQFSYIIYVSRSLIIKLWRLRWRVVAANKQFSFQPATELSECQWCGLISGGRLFHANGPETEKLRGPKPVVLVCGTTRSPWPAKRKWQRVETVETGLIIDTTYGATSWWRHLYTRIQILKSIRLDLNPWTTKAPIRDFISHRHFTHLSCHAVMIHCSVSTAFSSCSCCGNWYFIQPTK